MKWVDLFNKSLYISLGKETLSKLIYKQLKIHKISFLLILQITQDHWNLQYSNHYMHLEVFHSCLLVRQFICLSIYLCACKVGISYLCWACLSAIIITFVMVGEESTQKMQDESLTYRSWFTICKQRFHKIPPISFSYNDSSVDCKNVKPNILEKHLKEVMAACHKYQVAKAIPTLCAHMERHLGIENCCHYFIRANNFSSLDDHVNMAWLGPTAQMCLNDIHECIFDHIFKHLIKWYGQRVSYTQPGLTLKVITSPYIL